MLLGRCALLLETPLVLLLRDRTSPAYGERAGCGGDDSLGFTPWSSQLDCLVDFLTCRAALALAPVSGTPKESDTHAAFLTPSAESGGTSPKLTKYNLANLSSAEPSNG